MWSRNDQSSRRSENGKIFIKNLDSSIDNKAMYDTFSAFGNILSCRVATNEYGRSNGYGFVHFETEEAAKNAIWKVNGMLLNGKKVRIEKYVSRDERERELTENVKYFTNVYVKNFGTDLDDESIGELFSKYGKITSRKVMTDENGKSRGFGFVNFQDPKSAEKAVEELNGTELNSKILYVQRAQNKAERKAELKHKTEQLELEKMNRYRGANLYVKNLDDSIDDERLRKEFARFGTITSVKVMVDKGRSRRFGFVCFTTPDEATRALMEMHGRILFSKPLYVAFAQRKEDRKAHLAYQHIQKVTEHRLQMGQLLPQGNSGYFIPTVPHVCNGCHCVPPQQMRSGGAIATAYPPPFMRTSQTTNQQAPMRTCVNSRPYARWQPVPAQDGSKCKSNSNVCIPSPAILFQTSSSTGKNYLQFIC